MADEPSNSELAWRLDDIRVKLADLVGRAEYNAHQQGIDRRFADIGSDIQDLHRQHELDVQAVTARLDEHEKNATEHRYHWQQIVVPSATAFAVAIVGVIVEIWLAAHGQK